MSEFSTPRRAADAVDAAVSARLMLDHPFYQAWTAGELDRETLQAYARQYFHHVEAFPRAVSMTHALCEDRRGRRMLAENIAEEEGVEAGKTDHAELWMQFAEGLGAARGEVESVAVKPETKDLIDAFKRLSRRSYASGLGALYAYESQLPGVARTKIDGLKAQYGVDDERTLKFFTVHEAADEEHAAVCRELIDALPADEAAEAADAASELAGALWGFLDGMEAERQARAAA